jgi:hypothetical protein
MVDNMCTNQGGNLLKNAPIKFHHVGKPLKTLIEQTENRLPGGVKIITTQDITTKGKSSTKRWLNAKTVLSKAIEQQKVIVLHDDEVHLNRKAKGALDIFLEKKLNVKKYADIPQKWTNKNLHIIGYSASPFGHLTAINENPGIFTVIYMQPGAGYESLKSLKQNNRIENVEEPIARVRVLKNKKYVCDDLSKDFIKACEEFCNTEGPGYFIIRTKHYHKQLLPKIQDYFKNKKIKVMEAVAKYDGSIKQLKSDLEKKPSEKQVWIIRKAYGAGDTLCQDFIQTVWEGPSSQQETLKSFDSRLQEICRWCGYNTNKKIKIYVSHKVVDKIINFWDEIEEALTHKDGAEELNPIVLAKIANSLPETSLNESGNSNKKQKTLSKLKPNTMFNKK